MDWTDFSTAANHITESSGGPFLSPYISASVMLARSPLVSLQLGLNFEVVDLSEVSLASREGDESRLSWPCVPSHNSTIARTVLQFLVLNFNIIIDGP